MTAGEGDVGPSQRPAHADVAGDREIAAPARHESRDASVAIKDAVTMVGADASVQSRDAGLDVPIEAGHSEAPRDAGHSEAPIDAGHSDAGLASTFDAAAADAGLSAAGDAQIDAVFPFPALDTNGPPLEVKNGSWTYIEFPDTVCRDGSRAGISVSPRQPSTKLLVFLEGGLYCFDGTSCLFNPSGVEDLIFNSAKTAPTEGIFDRNNPQNPVRDWNIVYVPYCSGDGYGGTKTSPTDVPGGPRGQRFQGQLNLEKFLRRVVPSFRDATDVLLTGISAGGFGVLQSLVLVQRAFPWLKVRHVNDSGPPLSAMAAPPCMQDKFRTLWGLDDSTLTSCGASCPKRDAYFQDYSLFLARTLADRAAGFIDSQDDEMMRMLLGASLRDCTGSMLFDSLPVQTFRSDLLAYRDKLKVFPAYGTFIAKGAQHTWLRSNSFYSETANGTKLVDWFAKIAKGETAGHVGP